MTGWIEKGAGDDLLRGDAMNPNLLMLRDRIAAILDVLASGRIATGVRMLREMLADINAALAKENKP